MLRLSFLILALMTLAACGDRSAVERLDSAPLSGPAFNATAPDVQMTEQARALDIAMADLVRHSSNISTLSEIEPVLGQAQARMAWMNDRLADYVALQEQEMALLDSSRAAGDIRKGAYRKQVARITEARESVTQALNGSVAQARAAIAALKSTHGQGGGALDWHIMSFETLADEARQIGARAGLL